MRTRSKREIVIDNRVLRRPLRAPEPGRRRVLRLGRVQGRREVGLRCGVVCSGPTATNNVAEYAAVIDALRWLLEEGLTDERVTLRSDSQLVIFQLSGTHAVRSPRVRPLYLEARRLASAFRNLDFRWVPREQNQEADALSRMAYAQAVSDWEADKRARKAERLVPLVRRLESGLFEVPSESGKGAYVVDLSVPSCTCRDFEKRSRKCKHILAAEISAR